MCYFCHCFYQLMFLVIMSYDFLLLEWLVILYTIYMIPGIVKFMFLDAVYFCSPLNIWDLLWNADRMLGNHFALWGLILSFGRWNLVSLLCGANCIPLLRQYPLNSLPMALVNYVFLLCLAGRGTLLRYCGLFTVHLLNASFFVFGNVLTYIIIMKFQNSRDK